MIDYHFNCHQTHLCPFSSLVNNSSALRSFPGTKLGSCPRENISNSVTPYDQTSDENEYLLLLSTSGAYLKW